MKVLLTGGTGLLRGALLDRSPVFPAGVYKALVRPVAIRQSYDLPGAEPLTYLELVRTAAGALGRKPRIVRLPLEPMRRALVAVESLRELGMVRS